MTPHFAAIGIVTADMSASLAFYRRLGVEVPAGAESGPHAEAVLPQGVRILWDTDASVLDFRPDWSPAAPGSGRVNLAFACGSPEEVDSVYAEMTGAGYVGHKAPWDAPWGQRYAMLFDPDGNTVDLFAAADSGPAAPMDLPADEPTG